MAGEPEFAFARAERDNAGLFGGDGGAMAGADVSAVFAAELHAVE